MYLKKNIKAIFLKKLSVYVCQLEILAVDIQLVLLLYMSSNQKHPELLNMNLNIDSMMFEQLRNNYPLHIVWDIVLTHHNSNRVHMEDK